VEKVLNIPAWRNGSADACKYLQLSQVIEIEKRGELRGT